MDCTVHEVAKSSTRLSDFRFSTTDAGRDWGQEEKETTEDEGETHSVVSDSLQRTI